MAFVLIGGSFPLVFSSFVENGDELISMRFFVGLLGASFVPCQAWTTNLFSANVLGTANAIVGGWGNMGGGFSYLLMPQILAAFIAMGVPEHIAYKVTLIVPFVLCAAIAFLIIKLGPHTTIINPNENNNSNSLEKHYATETIISNSSDRADDMFTCQESSNDETFHLCKKSKERSIIETADQQLLKGIEEIENIQSNSSFMKTSQETSTTNISEGKSKEPDIDQNPISSTECNIVFATSVKEMKISKSMIGGFFKALRNPNIIILMINYACCFGIELAINNIIGQYFLENFHRENCIPTADNDKCAILNVQTAGLVGSSFGLMNFFSRASGGLLSDWLYNSHGMAGRIFAHICTFFISGAMLVVFADLTDLTSAIIVLVMFSIAIQMG